MVSLTDFQHPLPLWLGLHHRLQEDLHLLLPAAKAEGHQLLPRGGHHCPHAVANPGHAAGGLWLHHPLQELLPCGFWVFWLAGEHPGAEQALAEGGRQQLHGVTCKKDPITGNGMEQALAPALPP
ncbi:vesicle transport protein GOT1A isoform 2-T2 [Guaruba guarouba]